MNNYPSRVTQKVNIDLSNNHNSHTIALVTQAFHRDFSVSDLFTFEIMGGISRGLRSNGYDLLVAYVDPNEYDWANRYLDNCRVDGFILMTSSRKQNHIHELLATHVPFTVWGVPSPNNSYCSVIGDNFNGGKLATGYLLSTGRQHIAFLGGDVHYFEVQSRYEGYQAALQSAGQSFDPQLVAYGDFSDTSGAIAMRKLLQQAPNLDAVFVNSDLMAIAAMKVLRKQGRRVPDDVAVVGYDDLSIAESNNPPLTTIRQNIPQAGKLLAQNLIQCIQTGEVTNVIMPVELVVRESA